MKVTIRVENESRQFVRELVVSIPDTDVSHRTLYNQLEQTLDSHFNEKDSCEHEYTNNCYHCVNGVRHL